MGKAGRPPKLDAVKVAADLVSLSGNLAAVAVKNAVTRRGLQKFIARNGSLRDVVADAREGMLDNVESALYRAALDGRAWAVCFFLKTQGKSRGYVEKSDGGDVTVNHPALVIVRGARVVKPPASLPEPPAVDG